MPDQAFSEHQRVLNRPYCLAAFLYPARTEDGVVLLDLMRNKYLGITGSHDALLAEVVLGWPELPKAQITNRPGRDLAVDLEQKIKTLLTAGVLIKPSEARDPFPSISVSLHQDLVSISDEFRPRVRITLRHVLNFLWACALAAFSLRWRKLLVVAQDVRATRDAQQHAAFDCDVASEHVAVFRRLRCYVFSAKGRCLFHSLALVFFLQRYGVFPTWAIGIKTDTWEAHSWVQEGPYLLDTNPEKVCEFTPILGI